MSGPARNVPQARAGAWQTVATVTLGTVMLVLSSSALNIALPLVAERYRAGPLAATWTVLGFMLVQTCLLVVAGRVADRFDRRRIYLLGVLVFTVASLGAGFSPSIGVLIAWRVVQGVAAALVMANGTALIAAAVPPSRLSQAMGVYLGLMAAAPLIGPSVGGYLAENVGWEWVFWLNVPAGAATLVWGALVLPRSRSLARDPIDAVGAALLTGWLGMLVLAVSQAGSRESAGTGWLPAVAGPLLFLGFVVRQRKAKVPLVDPSLFTDRPFVLSGLATTLSAVGWVGNVFLMALYFQNTKGMSTAEAGLAVLPGPIVGMIASPIGGQLGRRFRADRIAVAGALTAAAGLAIPALLLERDTPYPLIAAAMILVSAGSGILYTANTTVIMMGVPGDRLGVVNGVRLTLHNLGNVLGPALCVAVASSRLAAEDRHLLYATAAARPSADAVAALVTGYRLAFAVFAAAALVASVLLVIAARGRTRAATLVPPPRAVGEPPVIAEEPVEDSAENPQSGRGA
ncbi:DHA2 family efflux MFS transporter permease subunit [Actinocorallia sp. A-T 12471]|uniref:DHA2 family efflux MFS transporter permease subunit n=1 Tax=Actinocorallia sp. A-T 12471 TaxID=3089813 RepID=UPI0029D377A9|nr:DHA2 family efflux MFS transporter permease subunit [Actinocorallia sp. A-T 12471]MDX6741977.1 DHA2 family efflux MFS transporter permease subunit [Actinocorallia sp. A-T 12471]